LHTRSRMRPLELSVRRKATRAERELYEEV
jgi:hypothetical protein